MYNLPKYQLAQFLKSKECNLKLKIALVSMLSRGPYC